MGKTTKGHLAHTSKCGLHTTLTSTTITLPIITYCHLQLPPLPPPSRGAHPPVNLHSFYQAGNPFLALRRGKATKDWGLCYCLCLPARVWLHQTSFMEAPVLCREQLRTHLSSHAEHLGLKPLPISIHFLCHILRRNFAEPLKC